MNVQGNYPIAYVSDVNPELFSQTLELALKYYDDSKKCGINKISKKEKKKLLKQISYFHLWPDSIFPEGIRLNSNEMFIYLSTEWNKRINIKDSSYFDTFPKIPRVFVFSKPIPFRNGKYYLVSYIEMRRIGSGSSEIAFYRKENDKWVKCRRISHGAF